MFSRGVTLANMIRLRTEANSGSTHSVTGILCRPALPTAFKRPMLASIWKTLRRGGGLSPPLHVCRRRSLTRARPTRLPWCPCQRHLMRGGAAGAGRIKWPTARSKRATHRFHTHSAARPPPPPNAHSPISAPAPARARPRARIRCLRPRPGPHRRRATPRRRCRTARPPHAGHAALTITSPP